MDHHPPALHRASSSHVDPLSTPRGEAGSTSPAIPPLSASAHNAAAARQSMLTKPPGSLGRLDVLACRVAAIQNRMPPSCERARVLVFAGDHGVAAQGVSAYPQAVTAQMCLNFLAGGAAVNVFAEQSQAEVEVIDVGVAGDLPAHPRLIAARVGRGTADFTAGAAMSAEHCRRAMAVGADRATAAATAGIEVLVFGEMGIANTTSAAALMAAVLDLDPRLCCGRGSGIDERGLERKRAVVAAGVARHRHLTDAGGLLAALGGYEIAAMAGAIIAAAAQRRVAVVDGFISSAAALVATRLAPECAPYLIYAHCGAERGHRRLLAELHAEPLLDLGLCLGEGTGGVLALHLLRAACRTMAGMATFAEAGVSER